MALSPSTFSLHSADLSTLLRINKGFPFHVTYKGNDAVVYQHALCNHFSQHYVKWKRHGKVFPKPLLFPLKFVPFDDNRVFNLSSTVEDLKTFAFLHMFFINAASADEYRSNIRHTVSEWFAGLSSRHELQWLIVVDTTKARERKNRSNLMDKIKADFSKHQHRLVEVSDSVEHSSFNALTSAVETSMFSHLALLTETWERCLKSGRDRCGAKDWSIIDCVNKELDYGRLFWSMGALEHTIMLYEDLDSLFFHHIMTLAEEDRSSGWPQWANELASAELVECPTLIESMRSFQVTPGTSSVAGIRHLLLSQKMLLMVQKYHAELHSPNNGAANPSARCDHAAVLIKYASNTLHAVIEHLVVLKTSVSRTRLSAWVIQLVGEALYLSGLLADLSTIDKAKQAVAAMHMSRFNELLSISKLASEDKKEERKALLEWMEAVVSKRETDQKSVNAHRAIDSSLSQLLSSLRSPSIMESTLLRAHDAASSFLTQVGRKRTAAQIGYEFALFLFRQNKRASGLPYFLRFVTSLMENGERSEKLLCLIESAIQMLHPEDDYERIVRFLLYMTQLTSRDEKRAEFAVKLKEELIRGSKLGLPQIRWTEWSEQHLSVGCKSILGVRLLCKGSQKTKIVPGEVIRMRVHVSSALPSVTMDGVRVRLRLSALSASISPSFGPPEKPSFDVEYRLEECKLVCVNGRLGSSSGKDGQSSEDKDRNAIELTHEMDLNCIDEIGKEVEVFEVAADTGIYTLERVEVTVFSPSLVLILPPSAVNVEKKMMMVIVEETKHSITFPNAKVLEAGVSEMVHLVLSAGSLEMPASTVKVTMEGIEEGDIELLSPDGLWESLIVLTVPNLKKEEQVEKVLRVCLPLKGEVNGEETIRKLRLEWSGRSFVHILRFSPLFTTLFTNSHLENRMLLDLEVSRPLDSSRWSIVPLEASLSIADPFAPIEPTLIHFDDQRIAPRAISSWTWLAAAITAGPPSAPFHLRLRYRVVAVDGQEELERGMDREYVYRLDADLEMKRVQYEVCSQVLSQQPGAQLCRVGAACHLVVSIRSLSILESDSLIVSALADERLWEIVERSKVVTLKESGLGQVYLVIVPLVAGFLPFPSLQLHAAASSLRSEDRFWLDSTEAFSVPPLFVFERTAGKQIRVLGASGGGEGGSVSSRGEKRTIKEKIQKLFD